MFKILALYEDGRWAYLQETYESAAQCVGARVFLNVVENLEGFTLFCVIPN